MVAFLVAIACAVVGYLLVTVAIDVRRLARGQAQSRTVEPPQWFDVLDVLPDAPPEEIRAAYVAKAAEYHAEKFDELPAEMRRFAERKRQEIDDAFAQSAWRRGR